MLRKCVFMFWFRSGVTAVHLVSSWHRYLSGKAHKNSSLAYDDQIWVFVCLLWVPYQYIDGLMQEKRKRLLTHWSYVFLLLANRYVNITVLCWHMVWTFQPIIWTRPRTMTARYFHHVHWTHLPTMTVVCLLNSTWSSHRNNGGRLKTGTVPNWPNSQIQKRTCSISHKVPFRTEMCTFLFWMEHCGICNRCILGLFKLLC